MSVPPPGASVGTEWVGRPGAARTIFFGSGAFGVPVLDALLEAPEAEVVAVVGVPDRPAGRRGALTPVPVIGRARALGLPILQPVRLRAPETIDALAALRPDLGILADYGRLVPGAILDLPPHGILNLHPSLLPRHRGASPIAATILEGDPEAGVTLMVMDERLDAGPILATSAWPLQGDEIAPDLEATAAGEAARLLRRHLTAWLSGRIEPRPQDEDRATMTRPLTREDGRLVATCPADRLARQVRAFQPWPGSYVDTAAGRLLVWRATPELLRTGPTAEGTVRPGSLVAGNRGIELVVADGRLRLDEVQLAGRRRMSGLEFARGHPRLVSVA